ncbi:carboxypeptidase-like regulatory domain-containing protein, partial [Schlesneria sp.]
AGKVNRVPDLVLTAGGTMTGRVCDHSGKVIEGAKVVLKQNNKEIAQTVTNNEGTYSFKNLKSGIYQVGSGNTDGVFRVWSEKTAPPSAKEHALLVMGENGARGQFGAVDPTLVLLTGGVIAAVVLSAIAVSEINSVKDTVNQIPISP